ncbi:MAG: hypothetical protein IPJ00_09355, partial [Saprospirales bacterium]|nr:hypothetical protein [Saprospirales bacterium]
MESLFRFFITTAFWKTPKTVDRGEQGLIFQNQVNGAHLLVSDFQGIPIRGVTGIVPLGGQAPGGDPEERNLYFDKEKNIHRLGFYQRGGPDRAVPVSGGKGVFGSGSKPLALRSGTGRFLYQSGKRKFKAVGQYRSEFSDEMNHVRAMTEDPSGNIWCLTRKRDHRIGQKRQIATRMGRIPGAMS